MEKKLDEVIYHVERISRTTDKLSRSLASLDSSCVPNSSPADEYFDALGSGKKEWRLVFRATAYNNVLVYPAYIYGTGIPTQVEAGCKQFNHSLPCMNHYRNRQAIENWGNVDEVLFAIYVKDQLVKYIIFNGRGSTFTDWFEGNRVIVSSWNDLKTLTHNIFSIEGDSRSQIMRRFLVNHHYEGCSKDKGWFLVTDLLPGICPYEVQLASPGFVYSKGNRVALLSSQDVAWADAVGIYLKYN
ncbi:hypothetical protein RRG08_055868 [Elysia crispata]|uniref:Uncharacterized protein n=1 Tax=Elysia crispata TaxID=231223 RepID=A0AAE0ZXH8_9GAST|nr:hypothetical protein RRG08_055868 [Elysia crispata]